ncbi:hypothetical protein GCM10009535_28080 [Streptomyces thermocarboxydovorans]|uniref:Uncharacterized protein n=1 Tax=Streptomyces thermocarboxydovorans TaxID=59298 RepID=A0ABN1HHP0_9ACTN
MRQHERCFGTGAIMDSRNMPCRSHPVLRAGLVTAGERVVIVGAGVAGLTTAVVLAGAGAGAGASVQVIAEQVPGATSVAAGAMCGP